MIVRRVARLQARRDGLKVNTPACRSEFIADDAPAAAEDFDDWVVRTVLNPAMLSHRRTWAGQAGRRRAIRLGDELLNLW
jgi:hypothetical protein